MAVGANQGPGFRNQRLPVFEAGNTIINTNGVFVYNGNPTTGNLVTSVTGNSSGIDGFGNHYLPNLTEYGAGIANSVNSGGIEFWTGSLAAGWTLAAAFFYDLTPFSNGGNYLIMSEAVSIETGIQPALLIGANNLSVASIEVQQPPIGGSPTTLLLSSFAPGDTSPRFTIDASGLESRGPGGSAATDTFVKRVGVGQLEINGASANGTYLLEVLQQATGTGGLSVFMNSANDFSLGLYVTGDTTGAPRFVFTGNGSMEVGPGGSTPPDSSFTRTAPNTFLLNTILNVAASLNVNSGKAGNVFAVGTGPSDFAGTVYLEDSTVPVTPGTATALYSKSGRLHYVSEDSNDYNVGDLPNVQNPVQTISSTTFVNVTNCTLHVGANLRYRIRCKVWYTSSAAAGTPQFQLSAPANTSPSFMATFIQGSTNPTVRAGTGSLTPGIGPTLPAAGTNSVFEMEADASFTAAGTVQLQALTSAVADTYVVQLVYMDLYPET